MMPKAINYVSKRPDPGGIVALVDQRNYGVAHGPQGNIRYLGSHGASFCVNLGMRTPKENEPFPRIAVTHLDMGIDLRGGIEAIVADNEIIRGDGTKTYLNSGCAFPEVVLLIKEELLRYGLVPTEDIGGGTPNSLVLDLITGEPISRESWITLHWFELEGEAKSRSVDRTTRLEIPEDRAVIRGIDLRKGIFAPGYALIVNKHNPIQTPQLHNKPA
jgi:hypothetical protein